MLQRVAAQLVAAYRRKEWLIGIALPLFEPRLQRACGVAPQRRAPFLPALAKAFDMRAGAQRHVLAAEVDQLGRPQPGLKRDQEDHVIASAGPGRSIRVASSAVISLASRNVTVRLMYRLPGMAR